MSHDYPDVRKRHIFAVYFSYAIIIFFSYVGEFFDIVTGRQAARFKVKKGYSPMFKAWDSFYTRRMYRRISDCWNRPVTGVPGSWMKVRDRHSKDFFETFELGDERKCLNLGSYNYLGFSDNKGRCLEDAQTALRSHGVSTCSAFSDCGKTDLHVAVERKTAEFLGKEECIIFSMGYHTNASSLPALAKKGDLILSDSLNHASLVVGCRNSGAKIKVFPHNDPVALERIIRNAIVEGQPRTHRPWNKILILVEGIYSMEGEICRLPEIVKIKNKYGCYIWVDEAHSIGALGDTGRGVCDYWGIDTKEIDLLMGTYTKSFAGVGGYITGDREVIEHLRRFSWSYKYSTSMSPPSCQAILTAMEIISGDDGTDEGQKKLTQLKDNANFFRQALLNKGFKVYGDRDSPVVPLMLYYPGKISSFSREAFKRNIAVVVVGYPATPLLMARTRFCLSAGHTREDLEIALRDFDEIGDKLVLKYEAR